MKQFMSLQVILRNKYEFYISFLVLLCVLPFCCVRPQGYYDTIIGVGACILALVCAFNAVLDGARMNWLERILAVVWFCALAGLTAYEVWDVLHLEVFSPR